MATKISFKKNFKEKNIRNYVLFTDENFRIRGLSKLSISSQANLINKTIKFQNSKGKNILLFNINSDQKIILVKIKNDQSTLENEKKGAEFYEFVNSNSILNSTLLENNIKDSSSKNKYFINEFLHGLKLKSYEFNKYITKKNLKLLK